MAGIGSTTPSLGKDSTSQDFSLAGPISCSSAKSAGVSMSKPRAARSTIAALGRCCLWSIRLSRPKAKRNGLASRSATAFVPRPCRSGAKAQPRSSAAASRVWTSCTVRCGKSAWITSKGRLPNCARARANSGLRPPPLSGNQRDGHSDTSVGARRYREPIAFTLDRQVITRAAIADASAMRSAGSSASRSRDLLSTPCFKGTRAAQSVTNES